MASIRLPFERLFQEFWQYHDRRQKIPDHPQMIMTLCVDLPPWLYQKLHRYKLWKSIGDILVSLVKFLSREIVWGCCLHQSTVLQGIGRAIRQEALYVWQINQSIHSSPTNHACQQKGPSGCGSRIGVSKVEGLGKEWRDQKSRGGHGGQVELRCRSLHASYCLFCGCTAQAVLQPHLPTHPITLSQLVALAVKEHD